MKEQNVSVMWEQDAAREWEKLNEDSFDRFGARSALAKSIHPFGQAYYQLSQAAAKTENTPYDSAMMAILEKLEDLRCEVEKLDWQMERGELE